MFCLLIKSLLIVIIMNIIIFGGTGSLGYKLVEKYYNDNNLYIYSRDEYKHHIMKKEYPNITFILGDIRDKDKLNQTFKRYEFNIVIIASALKHIEICELETNESINTNLLGTQNILNCIEDNIKLLTNLKCVCFVSSDKACSPVNVYGLCKCLSEKLMIEKSYFIKNIKFVLVRYGNVLNSRGSIIPLLNEIGKNSEKTHFTITHPNMTRFVMTLEQSVELIDHAINHASSGYIVIPKLVSCKIKDLIEIFSEIYNKPIKLGNIRNGEKLRETLINDSESLRIIHGKDNYTYITPPHCNILNFENLKEYDSNFNPFSKKELKNYLISLNLIKDTKTKMFPYFNLNFDKDQYLNTNPFPYIYIDNILDYEFAGECQKEILNIKDSEWDRYSNPFENKFTLRNKDNLPNNCQKLFNYLTSEIFIEMLSLKMGVKLFNDSTKNWWGIHKYQHNDNLDIHCDAGIHPITENKKHCTLGIYLSKNWEKQNKGHLEIWNGDKITDDNPKLKNKVSSILPKFNRLVLFNCTDNAWHGNPEPVNIIKDEMRIFLTISYLSNDFSESYSNKNKKAFFIKRPSDPENPEKDKLRLLRVDPEKYKEVYNINSKTQ